MKNILNKSFVRQHDQSDCGVACLLSVVRFHGGNVGLENLRRWSGTSKQGTTLLGLLKTAQQLGFEADGLEADGVVNLVELHEPAILHVVIDEQLSHYVVYYPHSGNPVQPNASLTIGDPAKGIVQLTPMELDKIWKSKALLKLVPNASFQKVESQRKKWKQWIVDLIRADFPVLTVSLALGVIVSVLGITTALFSQKLIDDILPKGNLSKLWVSLVLVTLLLLARGVINYLRSLLLVQQGKDFNSRIIQKFYSNLLALPKIFFDTRKIGELIARMNDTRRIQSVLAVVSGNMVIDSLVVVTSLVFLFVYSPSVGVVMLGSLPFYAWLLYRFNKPILDSQKEVLAGYAQTESNFVDTMQGVTEIKTMNKQPFFEKINEVIYGSFQNKMEILGKLQSRFSLFSDAVGVVFIVSVFGISSWSVMQKELSIGEIVAILGMASGIIPSANRLVISNIQIQEAFVVFDRMFEFTETEKETSGELPVPEQIEEVTIKQLTFRFPGRKQIIENASFQLRKGVLVTLAGESGGGKSTLLQLIQKFYKPESGVIEVNGMDLQSISTSGWRSKVACVSQEPKIFNGSLLFNVTLSNQEEELKEAVSFCERTGFVKYFREFPQSYFTLLGEEGINISGGQKQLVALARALFRKPKILLLDEATSSMDTQAENFILSLLRDIKSEIAVLMVTHREKPVAFSDLAIILDAGITRVSAN